ncbi:MAG: hypothetical protein ACE5G2_08510 [Candidatus Krumholzibacteriia bacterium]
MARAQVLLFVHEAVPVQVITLHVLMELHVSDPSQVCRPVQVAGSFMQVWMELQVWTPPPPPHVVPGLQVCVALQVTMLWLHVAVHDVRPAPLQVLALLQVLSPPQVATPWHVDWHVAPTPLQVVAPVHVVVPWHVFEPVLHVGRPEPLHVAALLQLVLPSHVCALLHV